MVARSAKPHELPPSAAGLVSHAHRYGFETIERIREEHDYVPTALDDGLVRVDATHLVEVAISGLHEERGLGFVALFTSKAHLASGSWAGGASLYRREEVWAVVEERRPHEHVVDRGKATERLAPTGFGHDTLVYLGGPSLPAKMSVTELRRVMAE